MSNDFLTGLTRDNPLLSRVTMDALAVPQPCAISDLSDDVAGYVRDSLAENTRRAYLSDLAHFEAWGGTVPATPDVIASYLAAHGETLSISTLTRRLASIAKAHRARGIPSPTATELVHSVLRGIKRTRGTAQREAKPLLKEDLFLALDAMGDSMKDVRDRALLLLGFAGGFRRSELVGLDHADIEHVRQGLVIALRRSKTDQEGAGRKIGIPHGRTRWCPVATLDAWMTASGITEGAVFRPVDRHGRIHEGRLSGEAIALVVRESLFLRHHRHAHFQNGRLPAGQDFGHGPHRRAATAEVQAGRFS